MNTPLHMTRFYNRFYIPNGGLILLKTLVYSLRFYTSTLHPESQPISEGFWYLAAWKWSELALFSPEGVVCNPSPPWLQQSLVPSSDALCSARSVLVPSSKVRST